MSNIKKCPRCFLWLISEEYATHQCQPQIIEIKGDLSNRWATCDGITWFPLPPPTN